MTVKEAIKALKAMPKDAELCIERWYEGHLYADPAFSHPRSGLRHKHTNAFTTSETIPGGKRAYKPVVLLTTR